MRCPAGAEQQTSDGATTTGISRLGANRRAALVDAARARLRGVEGDRHRQFRARRAVRSHEFIITIFRDRWARTKREITIGEPALIVPKLVELIDGTTAPRNEALPLLKLASFGLAASRMCCLRHDANVKLVYGVEIDYDGEVVAFGEAVRRMREAAVLGVLYTSPRHNPDAPRWRALCPFAGPMLATGRRGNALHAGRILGIELCSDSLTLSQSYYFGRVGNSEHFGIEVTDGDPIDTKRDLGRDVAVIGTQPPPPLLAGVRDCVELTDYCKGALTSAARNILNAPKGEQEITLNREAYTIGQAAGAGLVPAELALKVLELAAGEIPNLETGRPWRPGEAERKVQRAFHQGREKPRPACEHAARELHQIVRDDAGHVG